MVLPSLLEEEKPLLLLLLKNPLLLLENPSVVLLLLPLPEKLVVLLPLPEKLVVLLPLPESGSVGSGPVEVTSAVDEDVSVAGNVVLPGNVVVEPGGPAVPLVLPLSG